MKYKNKTVIIDNTETIVIPKGDDEYVFKFGCVVDYSEFDSLCPEPIPPEIIKKGGQRVKDVTDKEYIKQLNDYGLKKSHYLFLKSISATEDLEFDTVDIQDPETWGNANEELRTAGFSVMELNCMYEALSSANGLSQSKIDKATKDFLAGAREELEQQSSQVDEHSNTQSGEPVKD